MDTAIAMSQPLNAIRVSTEHIDAPPCLLGVLLRGMTFEGEIWRLATIGDWKPIGPYLLQPAQMDQLHKICRDLVAIFSSCSNSEMF